MINVLLFDFFDVIHADHQKAWLAAHGYKREGGFAEASDLLDAGQIDFEEYLARYAALADSSPAAILADFKEFGNVDTALVALIEQLHEQYRTGLISNAHSNELRPLLDMHDLHGLFDEIVISSEVGMAKPNPQIFTHICKQLQVEPSECVFTDDNPANVAAAKTLGMQGIVYTDVTSYQQELAKLLKTA